MLIASRPFPFAAKGNGESFQFGHDADASPVFDVSELVGMAARLPDDAYSSTLDAGVDGGWKGRGGRQPSVCEILETLPQTNSLVLLKRCEKDPVHGPALQAIIDETIERCDPTLRDDIEVARATIIVSSPGRITPYHIDAEVNFLLQMRGRKILNVFNPSDAGVLTPPELESFYTGNWDGAHYKADRQSEACVYDLEPGIGVHIPLHAPHWARNGDAVSVGLSLNFTLRSGARLAKLHKVNHRLRRAGFAPAPPGASALRDTLKLAMFEAASVARPIVKRAYNRRAQA